MCDRYVIGIHLTVYVSLIFVHTEGTKGNCVRRNRFRFFCLLEMDVMPFVD